MDMKLDGKAASTDETRLEKYRNALQRAASTRLKGWPSANYSPTGELGRAVVAKIEWRIIHPRLVKLAQICSVVHDISAGLLYCGHDIPAYRNFLSVVEVDSGE